MPGAEDILSNIGLLLSVVLIVVFVLIRKEVSIALMRKFFRGKGWVTVRMFMPDRQEVEAFVNLRKKPTLHFFGRSYIYDMAKATFKLGVTEEVSEPSVTESKLRRVVGKILKKPKKPGLGLKEYKVKFEYLTRYQKFPVINFRWDRSEPIDPYDLGDKGMDSSLVDAAIMRAKAQSSIKELFGQNKKVIMFFMIAAAAAAAAAYFSYENYAILKILLERGIALK